VDDLIAIGGELCTIEHLVVRNDIVGVVILACVDRNLHVVADVELFFASVDSLVVDVDEGFLVKHYVQSILGSEHADWMIEILVFDSMIQMWIIFFLVFLSLLEWKPLVKMKVVVDLSLGIKVWDKLFYLPGESDVGASRVFLVTTLEFMGGCSIVSLEGSCTGAQHTLELGMVYVA